jgi:hypothetical protein
MFMTCHTLNKIRDLWCFSIKVYRISLWKTGICHKEKYYYFFLIFIFWYICTRENLSKCAQHHRTNTLKYFKENLQWRLTPAATKQAHSTHDTLLQSVHPLTCHTITLFHIWLYICFTESHVLTGLVMCYKHYILTGLGTCSKRHCIIQTVTQCLVIYLYHLLSIPI